MIHFSSNIVYTSTQIYLHTVFILLNLMDRLSSLHFQPFTPRSAHYFLAGMVPPHLKMPPEGNPLWWELQLIEIR